jgi:hypothetical protein
MCHQDDLVHIQGVFSLEFDGSPPFTTAFFPIFFFGLGGTRNVSTYQQKTHDANNVSIFVVYKSTASE